MDIEAAQRDLGRAYVGGAPGVLASGVVWLVAGGVLATSSVDRAFLALFFGGMLIQPAAVAVSRLVFRAGPVTRGNPLERLALETTVLLFAGILIAWLLLRLAPAAALPAFAVVMGGRYFAFATLYGDRRYWALGGAIMLVGTAFLLRPLALPLNAALWVGAVEVVFAGLVYGAYRRVAAGRA
ncbi:DUF7010 family protein [Sandarakinorhabdus sp. DWP1-3-1]|uniref:DUF7010 family protein n=1 Tax=Sandarakinorhabdus sp. DWP1-3-1 TaxID=2804627 RepID=UPI003CEEB6F5